jgi:hypothetical protein
MPLIYTVTMADPPPDNTREYTVKVIKIPEITITYASLKDDKFTTESFDQNTGLLIIKILDAVTDKFPLSAPTYRYGPPYSWYVDGVKQSVSDTQNTLVIKTAGFGPGRHQVTVSATRTVANGGDGKHYTNILSFDVKE